MMIHFPQDVWFQIQSYAFQLSYPPDVQQQYIRHIQSLVRLPFFLKLDNQKNLPYQYAFLKEEYPLFWHTFNDDNIRTIISREITRMHVQHETTYIKQFCHGIA
jgi:hypothetical protein